MNFNLHGECAPICGTYFKVDNESWFLPGPPGGHGGDEQQQVLARHHHGKSSQTPNRWVAILAVP